MGRRAHNIVLYRGGTYATRHPLFSLSPDDKVASAKIVAKIGNEMRAAELSGVACPEFRVISEQREADEGGQFVIRAEFRELDPTTLKPLSREFNSLQELYDAKPDEATAQPVPETAQQQAEREARARSAALSV